MRHLGIFINNTSTDLKYRCSINNFQKLNDNFNKIIIFDNNSLYSNKLKQDIIDNNKIYKYIILSLNKTFEEEDDKNDINYERLLFILRDINDEYFDYITVINDNYIYNSSLENYFKYIYKHEMDFYSYTDSTENQYHHQMNLFTFKTEYLNKLVKSLNKSLYSNTNANTNSNNNTINKSKDLETNLFNVFKNKMTFIKVAYLENNYKQNIYFNDVMFKYLLTHNIINLISIQKLNKILTEYKSIYTDELPDNFDVEIYRKYNDDLKNYDDDFLKQHYIKYGQYEFRSYTNDYKILPDYIKIALYKTNNVLPYFEIPFDFNIHKYNISNKDLNLQSRDELLIQWIKKGKYDGRRY